MNQIRFDNTSITPSKVVCVGRNYVEHIHELGNEIPSSMVLFNKPNSAITDQLFYFDEACRFEGEICFSIQGSGIAGIGFGLDLTHADIQNRMKEKGLPWERAKAFDGSAVLSAFVPFDPAEMEKLSMKLFRNGELAQYATYDLMIYKPDEIVREISSFMTLEDGDIIMSGTPKGVSTYARGDHFAAQLLLEESIVLECEFTAL
jgi:2-keto-4-pentenoate hydratase/2-oxohepta-3-ene-1,7-dioic acid hydratase in catechol pathway